VSRWRKGISSVASNRTGSIDVAIRRTLRAVAERTDFIDVLVDSVIAWENLMGSQQGEPTLRVSGSLAWLLGKTPTERMALRAELAKLYHLRSQVVHGNERIPDNDLVTKSQRSLQITVSALRALFTDRLDLLRECKSGAERSNQILMGG
jgi:Apea-like HEPN